MKILIVDDELISRQKLAVLLKKHGCCDQAENGEAAYALFCNAFERGEPYDLVTLDYQMPGLSGPDLLKKIRKYEEEQGVLSREDWVKVIMVTAKDDTRSVMTSYLRGCEEYLVKPFSPEDLERSLQRFA